MAPNAVSIDTTSVHRDIRAHERHNKAFKWAREARKTPWLVQVVKDGKKEALLN